MIDKSYEMCLMVQLIDQEATVNRHLVQEKCQRAAIGFK